MKVVLKESQFNLLINESLPKIANQLLLCSFLYASIAFLSSSMNPCTVIVTVPFGRYASPYFPEKENKYKKIVNHLIRFFRKKIFMKFKF